MLFEKEVLGNPLKSLKRQVLDRTVQPTKIAHAAVF